MKFRDLKNSKRVDAVNKNKEIFIEKYGVPEGGNADFYRSYTFMYDFLERNDIDIDKDGKAILP